MFCLVEAFEKGHVEVSGVVGAQVIKMVLLYSAVVDVLGLSSLLVFENFGVEGVISDLPLVEAEVDELFGKRSGPPGWGSVRGPIGVMSA